MRKYIIGGLVGAALMLSFNVSAAVESFIGKSVDNEYVVKLDGKELNNKALAVDGNSYAPVRVIAESLGLNVDFQNNEVLLNQKTTAPVATTPAKIEVPKMTLDELNNEIYTADLQIRTNNIFIGSFETRLKEDKSGSSNNQKSIDDLKKQNEELKTKLTDLEKQKSALQP